MANAGSICQTVHLLEQLLHHRFKGKTKTMHHVGRTVESAPTGKDGAPHEDVLAIDLAYR
ncbi:MAG: hypothetical protein ACFCVA_19645 [Gammaproteobacteria bacterium]